MLSALQVTVPVRVIVQIVSFAGPHCPKKSFRYLQFSDNIQELNATHCITALSLCEGLERSFLGYFQGAADFCRGGKKSSKWEFIWCWTHLHSQIRARLLLHTSSSREACWGCEAKCCANYHTLFWQMLSSAKPTAPWNTALEGLQLPQFPSTFTWWWQQHTVTPSDSWWPQCKQSSQEGELLSSQFLPGDTMTTLTWATDATLPIALLLTATRYSCCWA